MIRLNLTALLFSNKNIELAYHAKRICRSLNINLINAVDFVDLTTKVFELKPQIVFFDLLTIKMDKEIIKLFASDGEYHIPNIVLIYENDKTMQEYSEFSFVGIKANELESVLEKEQKTFALNSCLYDQKQGNLYFIFGEINKHLFSMGFSPKHTGYAYLVEAIKIAVKKNGVVGSLNNEVYPFIAAKYGTTVSNVERNIRNAIVCAFDCYDRVKDKVQVCPLFSMFDDRPTNREFICMYIEYIMDMYYKKQNC